MSKMGQDLIEAMGEVLEHVEGKTKLRTTRLAVQPVAEEYSADTIKGIRRKLGMTQVAFAMLIGVSRKTVESWETGRYNPDGAARRLLSVLEQDPKFPEKYGIYTRA